MSCIRRTYVYVQRANVYLSVSGSCAVLLQFCVWPVSVCVHVAMSVTIVVVQSLWRRHNHFCDVFVCMTVLVYDATFVEHLLRQRRSECGAQPISIAHARAHTNHFDLSINVNTDRSINVNTCMHCIACMMYMILGIYLTETVVLLLLYMHAFMRETSGAPLYNPSKR